MATNDAAEMSPADHNLLLKFLQEKKPKKILEIGVSAGGTTAFLLKNKEKDAILHSVDICKKLYKDESKQTGYIAENMYSPSAHGEWNRHFGKDISDCIEEIGPEIDFIVLDTVHLLPGEFLSFLAVIPFIHENTVLFLHDISLHIYYRLNPSGLGERSRVSYCTGLLFNAIPAENKFFSDDAFPNSGIILLEKEKITNNIYGVLNSLLLDWEYFPSENILHKTRELLAKNYAGKELALFDLAVRYNSGWQSKLRRKLNWLLLVSSKLSRLSPFLR